MFARIRPRWHRGAHVTRQNLVDLDENTARAIDGHDGGSYEPSGDITIGGAGMIATGPWSTKGSVLVDGSDSSRIIFGKGTADDAFCYHADHTARTRALLRGLDEAHGAHGTSVVSIDTGYVTIQTNIPGARFFTAIRTRDGGTLSTVVFRWKVGVSHANVPAELPRFRVVRVDAMTGLIEPLRPEGMDTDADGFVMWGPRPASGANYYDSGALKTMTYTCTQNNVIDRSKYFYLAEIIDESGSNAFSGAANTGNFFNSTVATIANIDHLSHRCSDI